MLKNLYIENYALIQKSNIAFSTGFTAITGETGAGKSILLGALGLVLGQRADSQVLFNGDRKCIVEAQFDITSLCLEKFFEANDLDYDESLTLRREILPSTKSRAFINDTPVTLPVLKELGQNLINIHSQHETLTLVGTTFQTSLLDTFNGGTTALQEYSNAYHQYHALKRRLESLIAEDAQSKKDLDYNQFLFDELQSANLLIDEQESLEQEVQLLEHTESIKQALTWIENTCDGEDESVISRLISAKSQLSHIASYHNPINELHTRLESNIIELQDILSEIQAIDDTLQFSPERLEFVNGRLDTIYRLQKKHGVNTCTELLEIQNRLNEQLQAADNLDEQIRLAMEAVDQSYNKVRQLADRQTAIRKESSIFVEKKIIPILTELGMKEAKLQVQITASAECGELGADNVKFLFNANKGGELRELSKIASGGELSRLMLAIKSIVSHETLLPTIIFDEIDTGVSGDISIHVGDILQTMSQHMQVIAITHLPQIAARANHHLWVYKDIEQDYNNKNTEHTISHIRELNLNESVHEIAVMLSSEPPTESALQTARELMGGKE